MVDSGIGMETRRIVRTLKPYGAFGLGLVVGNVPLTILLIMLGGNPLPNIIVGLVGYRFNGGELCD